MRPPWIYLGWRKSQVFPRWHVHDVVLFTVLTSLSNNGWEKSKKIQWYYFEGGLWSSSRQRGGAILRDGRQHQAVKDCQAALAATRKRGRALWVRWGTSCLARRRFSVSHGRRPAPPQCPAVTVSTKGEHWIFWIWTLDILNDYLDIILADVRFWPNGGKGLQRCDSDFKVSEELFEYPALK